MIKRCCRCDTDKPVTDYHKSKRGLFGVHSICRSCKADYMLQYRLSGKLKTSKAKYKASAAGKAVIRAYTLSKQNKQIQERYRKSAQGRARCVSKLAKYRAKKLQAQPSWVDTATLHAIYANCPSGLEVDHIIPLQGKDVCGLHVPWNLQYLTRRANASKGNKYAKS